MKRRADRLLKLTRKNKERKRIGKVLGISSAKWQERKENIATRVHNREVQVKYKSEERKKKNANRK